MGSLHRIEREGESLHLAAAPAAVRGRGHWVLVPSTAVMLTTVELPGVARSAWPRAVPFALEDEVSEPLDTLHFAPAQSAPAGELPVAVVGRRRMEEWLAACADAGARPRVMMPDVLALPWSGPGAASVLLTDEGALVRTGACSGFGTELDALETYLAAWTAGAEAAATPDSFDLYDARTGAPSPGVPEAVARLGAPVREHARIGDLGAWLAAGLPPRPALNLLQGSFEAGAAWWRPSWPAAAALLALWIAAQSLVGVLETNRLRAEAQQLEAHLADLLDPAARPAPGRAGPPAAGSGAIEQRVRRMLLAASRPAPDFLGLLTLSAPVLAEVQPLELQRMAYEDERIVLDLHLGNPGLLDALLARLRERGFAIDVLSLVNRDTEVEARIRLGRAR